MHKYILQILKGSVGKYDSLERMINLLRQLITSYELYLDSLAHHKYDRTDYFKLRKDNENRAKMKTDRTQAAKAEKQTGDKSNNESEKSGDLFSPNSSASKLDGVKLRDWNLNDKPKNLKIRFLGGGVNSKNMSYI